MHVYTVVYIYYDRSTSYSCSYLYTLNLQFDVRSYDIVYVPQGCFNYTPLMCHQVILRSQWDRVKPYFINI